MPQTTRILLELSTSEIRVRNTELWHQLNEARNGWSALQNLIHYKTRSSAPILSMRLCRQQMVVLLEMTVQCQSRFYVCEYYVRA